ncbi:MAG: PAS domain-containing sensor histidine kinase [Hymenobacter sp.]|nr:MAG: PAS domain-containing sensor histidine kinase [Hymenobacter sp.]
MAALSMSDLAAAERHAFEAHIQTLQDEVARLQAIQHQQAADARAYQRPEPFRTVFDQSPLGHKIIGPDLLIRQANAASATLLGLESSLEVVGHAILEFTHPDSQAEWAGLQAALWTHRLPSFALEACLLRSDGMTRWCRVTSVLFWHEGEELGYTTLEDISARKHLEARVQQHHQDLQTFNEELQVTNEELQVANEELLNTNTALGKLNMELDSFVYAASHDLRSPLSNLQGLVQALWRQLPPDSAQRPLSKPILDMMQDSLARLGQSLDRLADFSTTYAPQELPRERVELSRVLEEVRQEVGPLLAATQGQLVVDLAGNPGLWFAAKHVYSVLFNLISNALKYRHPDRLPRVQVRSHREAGRLVVRVQDNGLGLSPAQPGQLFHLFKRLHNHPEGTGVGLYLVKKILDNAGGSVQVESVLGQGSTFTVFFPT